MVVVVMVMMIGDNIKGRLVEMQIDFTKDSIFNDIIILKYSKNSEQLIFAGEQYKTRIQLICRQW